MSSPDSTLSVRLFGEFQDFPEGKPYGCINADMWLDGRWLFADEHDSWVVNPSGLAEVLGGTPEVDLLIDWGGGRSAGVVRATVQAQQDTRILLTECNSVAPEFTCVVSRRDVAVALSAFAGVADGLFMCGADHIVLGSICGDILYENDVNEWRRAVRHALSTV